MLKEDEPPGSTNAALISSRLGSEAEQATLCLRKQARALEATSFRCMKVDATTDRGLLPTPHFVFFLEDGRALAWIDASHPFVVHPCLADLYRMHGLNDALVHAA